MMTKKKKLNNQNLSPSSPGLNTNMELDNKALRAKNSQLVQTVAKLQQEKAQQQNQITSLQEEYFNLNSKFMNLRNVFSTIDTATKQWFSKYVELSDMCTKILQLCGVGMAISNLNKDTRTQAVKPQIVNGHILHDPIINISRLTDISSHTPSPRKQSPQRSNRLENLPLPSTSRVNQEEEEEEDVDNNSDESHLVNLEEPRFYSRRPVRATTLVPMCLDNVQQEDTPEMDTEQEEEPNDDDEDYCPRLITIQEEEGEDEEEEEEEDEIVDYSERSLNSSKIFAERVREVRIYIDPLPIECLKRSRNSNSSKQSISIRSNTSSSCKQEASTSRISPNRKKSLKKQESDYFHNSSTFEDTANKTNTSDLHLSKEVNDTFIQNSDFSRQLSLITSVPSCSTPFKQGNFSSFNSSDNSKEDVLRSLGLEPNRRLTTSTPISVETRKKKRKKFAIYSDDDSLTPKYDKLSNINKQRGGSNDKLPKVILKRLSFEKRKSGSPINIIGEVFNTPVITRVSEIKRRSSSVKKIDIQKSDKKHLSKEIVKNTNVIKTEHNACRSSGGMLKKSPSKDKQVPVLIKKVQTRRVLQSPRKNVKVSPRPKRAARPTASFKEISLIKKMRRSK